MGRFFRFVVNFSSSTRKMRGENREFLPVRLYLIHHSADLRYTLIYNSRSNAFSKSRKYDIPEWNVQLRQPCSDFESWRDTFRERVYRHNQRLRCMVKSSTYWKLGTWYHKRAIVSAIVLTLMPHHRCCFYVFIGIQPHSQWKVCTFVHVCIDAA